MRIALDAMGGDFAPQNPILGALEALNESKDLEIVLLGETSKMRAYLPSEIPTRLIIKECGTSISMSDNPTRAFIANKESSIVTGFNLLKAGKVDAFCSAGNTGAMQVGSAMVIKAIDGIHRPGIAGFVPKESGKTGVIIDIGANTDSKPEVLAQFGLIGSIYAQHVLQIAHPKVALMNIGEESKKGTPQVQAAYKLLQNQEHINFIGNIEGRDLVNNKADVIVCDGFTGNIILKMAEMIFDLMRRRDRVDDFLERFNYEKIGASPILGINGIVLIGHGVSSTLAIKNMIFQGVHMAESKIHVKIGQSLGF